MLMQRAVEKHNGAQAHLARHAGIRDHGQAAWVAHRCMQRAARLRHLTAGLSRRIEHPNELAAAAKGDKQ